MDYGQVFKEKDAEKKLSLSKLSLMFIRSNPTIKNEFIRFATEEYKNVLESYLKVLDD